MQCDYFDAGRCRSCTLMGTPYAEQLADKDDRAAAALAPSPPSCPGSRAPAARASPTATRPSSWSRAAPGTATLGILDERGRGVDLRALRALRSRVWPPTFDPLHRLRVRPRARALRRAGVAGVSSSTYRHALPRRRAPRALRAALRAAPGAPACRPPQLSQAACPRRGWSPSTCTPSTRRCSRATPRSCSPSRPCCPCGSATPPSCSARSFFQTNTAVAASLYRQARDWVDEAGPAVVWTSTAAWAASPCTRPGRVAPSSASRRRPRR